MIRRLVLILLSVMLAATPAAAASAVQFASLRGDRVYMRVGPTFLHPVLWVYRRRDYPVEIVASYESWRRVRDSDGAIGWINEAMLSDARSILVTGLSRAAIRSAPQTTAAIQAWADPGVVAKLKACEPQFCKIDAGGVTGWIDKARIWGVAAGELFH